jgi:hypothetical protein
MWSFQPNTYVDLWKGVPIGVFPPVAAAAYSGAAQLVLPKALTVFQAGMAWFQKLYIPQLAVTFTTADVHSATTAVYVRFDDGNTGLAVGWWQAYDISPSTYNSSVGAIPYRISGTFLALQSV